ncbi:MAG: hypothetical protein QOG01_3846 [Pseudonocardiales bacterium]|nr:hypothetical protein [Pseudonocardiales bacterium]
MAVVRVVGAGLVWTWLLLGGFGGGVLDGGGTPVLLGVGVTVGVGVPVPPPRRPERLSGRVI